VTPVERIARLVGLLDRVQRNAAAPRSTPAATPTAPRAAAAPAAKSAPVPAPLPPVVPAVAAAPAPVAAPPPAPAPAPVAAAPAYPPVPPGFELDAPGDDDHASVPPPAALPPQPALSSWPAEPISAVQPRPSEAPEELDEDDVVEMTTLPPATNLEERGTDPDLAVALSSSEDVEISIDEDEEEEQPPASSRRPKLSEESDEITETALDEGRHVPVKTPPPESGPQEAALPTGAALSDGRLPDVEQFEADMLGTPSMGPTAEQLGETIELEAPLGPELEIDVAAAPPAPPLREAPHEELEVALPRAPMLSGTFDLSVSIPPIDISTKIEPLPTVPAARSIQESPTSLEIRSTSADVTVRPTHGATDVARVTLARVPASKVFLDILDQSLAL
jgi:hypothetical protein